MTAAIALAANAKAAHAHQLNNEELIAFLFAGKAIFTLFNEETTTRYTYLVEQKAYKFQGRDGRDVNGTCFWVCLLTGPHNTKDYTYLGSLKNETERTFTLSPKSRVGDADLASVKAINWLLNRIAQFESEAHDRTDVTAGPLKFWAAGRCGRCGRTLTVTSSIQNGFGPECSQYAALGVAKNLKVKELA